MKLTLSVPIKIGSVVYLKSGSPPMAVMHLDSESVYCKWFEQIRGCYKLHEALFSPDALVADDLHEFGLDRRKKVIGNTTAIVVDGVSYATTRDADRALGLKDGSISAMLYKLKSRRKRFIKNSKKPPPKPVVISMEEIKNLLAGYASVTPSTLVEVDGQIFNSITLAEKHFGLSKDKLRSYIHRRAAIQKRLESGELKPLVISLKDFRAWQERVSQSIIVAKSITVDGVLYPSIAKACKELGISRATMYKYCEVIAQ